MKKILIILGWLCGSVFGGLVVNCYAEAEGLYELPEIYVKAINPGYTIDGKSNVGEMIEIGRKRSDTPILLAGTTVSYTNSSGNDSILFDIGLT